MEQDTVMGCAMQLFRQFRRSPEKGRHSHSAMRLLRLIWSHENASAKELSQMLGIRPPSLSEQLDRLQARGFITRARDGQDARVIRVSLTDAGREEMRRLDAEHDETRQRMEEVLTPEERIQFCQMCRRMTEALAQCEQARPDLE